MKAIVLFGHALLGYSLWMPGCGKTTAPVTLPPQPIQRGLQVGMTAPEIDGPDLDGVRFKLSDHRGQVVLLDFWGEFCPPCRALYGHEKALVEKFRGRPFVLLGVNADDSLETARQGVAKNGLNWRSWHDSPDGAIGERYQIRGYPSLFLIDARGVLRAIPAPTRNVIEEMEREIEKLLQEVS